MKNLSDDALLTQLGYQPNEALKKKLESVIKNTKGFENIKPHLLALHDNIKIYDGLVALSSSHDFFKIKNENYSKVADEYIHKWANKYKVSLQKIEGKNTYYILGQAA